MANQTAVVNPDHSKSPLRRARNGSLSVLLACFRKNPLNEIGMQAKMMLFDQFRQKGLDRGRVPKHFGA